MNWIFEAYSDIYRVVTKPHPIGRVTRLEPSDRPRTTRWDAAKR
jgi:hypothetical protein